jgi:purine-binding chemotaxis protein CheW
MPQIDWSRLYQRLDDTRKALEEVITPDPERIREVLRKRAEVLGRPPVIPSDAGDRINVVEFLLAHERYGIELSFIREVAPLKDLVRLPSAPPFVLGMIHVRGEIISVIDIKKFFGLPEKGLTDLNRVLITRAGDIEVGILADAILSVRSFPAADLHPAPATLTGIRADYIKGITSSPVVVLDVKKMLSDKRVLVDKE